MLNSNNYNSNYGILNRPSLELQRRYFDEMCKLRGIIVKYYYPINKDYTLQGELISSYSEPLSIYCIFNENINRKTTKKLGWVAELDTDPTIISVPYDLENLQTGCIFAVPSPFDNTEDRLFRVVEMSAIPAYPASITCRLVPEYKTTAETTETEVFTNSNFNLLYQEDEEEFKWRSKN